MYRPRSAATTRAEIHADGIATNVTTKAFTPTDDKRGPVISGDNEEQETWPKLLTEPPIAA